MVTSSENILYWDASFVFNIEKFPCLLEVGKIKMHRGEHELCTAGLGQIKREEI